eukprot:COSAG01_NODE_14_length_41020_cov_40.702133_26_plen_266_part_00
MISNILQKIVDKKKREVEKLYKKKIEIKAKVKEISIEKKINKKQFDFYKALNKPGLNLIAELKKASPSKGIINSMFDPLSLASKFENKGASALSILTDEDFFQGRLSYIPLVKSHINIPILRKEFIIDPLQIYESKIAGASAILLIANILNEEKIKELQNLAHKFKMDVLLEVHTENELNMALNNKDTQIIGINNRNLHDFSIDRRHSLNLLNKIKQYDFNGCTVAESGYKDLNMIQEIAKAGFNGVLIGEGLIKAPELFKAFER